MDRLRGWAGSPRDAGQGCHHRVRACLGHGQGGGARRAVRAVRDPRSSGEVVDLDHVADRAHVLGRRRNEVDWLARTDSRRVTHGEADAQPPHHDLVRLRRSIGHRPGRSGDVRRKRMHACGRRVSDLAVTCLHAASNQRAGGQVEDLDRKRGRAGCEGRCGLQDGGVACRQRGRARRQIDLIRRWGGGD